MPQPLLVTRPGATPPWQEAFPGSRQQLPMEWLWAAVKNTLCSSSLSGTYHSN